MFRLDNKKDKFAENMSIYDDSQSGNSNHLAIVISLSNDALIHFQWKRKERKKTEKQKATSLRHHILLSASSTEMFDVRSS